MKIHNLLYMIASCLIILLLTGSEIFAEEYKVCWSMLGFNDRSKIQEEDPIDVETAYLKEDKQKAIIIATSVLKRDVAEEGYGKDISFKVQKVIEGARIWRISFIWQYKSDIARGQPMNRYFSAEIDMDTKDIVYVRSLDPKHGG